MLKALYDYAERMELTVPVGYKSKTIKAFIRITGTGEYSGLTIDDGNSFLCPDIGNLAKGTDKCNLLVEKRTVIFPKFNSQEEDGVLNKEKKEDSLPPKSCFFKLGLQDFSNIEPLAKLCFNVLDSREICDEIRADLDMEKIKDSDKLSFIVDNQYLIQLQSVEEWWTDYRKRFTESVNDANLSLCLISGEVTTPVATVPTTTGLKSVGGHPGGDALICFDKKAFCSYGLQKSANAPVSEEAYDKVRIALDELLKNAPTIAGMKFVHWYDKAISQEEDLLTEELFPGFISDEAIDDEEENDIENIKEMMSSARREADRLVSGVETGASIHSLPNVYFILLLSGAGGRVMVRRYERGSYQALEASLRQWNSDLCLVNSEGTGNIGQIKLSARLIRLLKRQKDDRKKWERLGKELSGSTPVIINAVMNRQVLFPDSVAFRSLAFIRSQMMTDETESNRPLIPDPISCQWLKAWLIRNQKEENLMPAYNPNHPSTAYQLGAMMAVYADLQQRAYPDVNVTVVQRFFASAMQTPAMVFHRLSTMSVHHLAKLEKGTACYYSELLAEISSKIDDEIPTTMNASQQSLFALGYYQYSAELIGKKKAYFSKREEK